MIDNFQDFRIEKVFKKGVLMVEDGAMRDFPAPEIEPYLTQRAHTIMLWESWEMEVATAPDLSP